MTPKRSLICLLSIIADHGTAQSSCGNVQLTLSPDYSFAIGSSSRGSAYTFSEGSQTLAQGPMTQLAIVLYDNSLIGTSGVAQAQSTNNPAVLDAAWAAGELHMIDTLRKLLPYGYVSGHLNPLWPIPAAEFSAFNGNSLNKGAI